jgi:hypothetical protein
VAAANLGNSHISLDVKFNMAVGIGGKGINPENTGYLSEESDFYGTHISTSPDGWG